LTQKLQAAARDAAAVYDIEETLKQQPAIRPVLLCRWLQDANGRLSCYWEVALPGEIS
jgi:hypothetical protein